MLPVGWQSAVAEAQMTLGCMLGCLGDQAHHLFLACLEPFYLAPRLRDSAVLRSRMMALVHNDRASLQP